MRGSGNGRDVSCTSVLERASTPAWNVAATGFGVGAGAACQGPALMGDAGKLRTVTSRKGQPGEMLVCRRRTVSR